MRPAGLLLLPALALAARAGEDTRAAVEAALGQPALSLKAPAPDAAAEAAGRALFRDPSLSPGRDLSCASCHDPARGWSGTRAPGGREIPSLLGAGRRGPFFWDGRAATLEDAILSELRERLDDRALAARLDSFPLPPGPGSRAERAARALAAFLRTDAAGGKSAFHRARVDDGALTPAAARGLEVFVGKGKCANCHVGPALSDASFYRVGLADADPPDRGREALVPVRSMRGGFRTPPLLSAGRTAPYMHDGRFKTLKEVVEFFDRGGDDGMNRTLDVFPLGLSAAERADLVEFLTSALDEPLSPVPPRAAPPPTASARAESFAALAANDRPALRDAADAWARELAARRAGGKEAPCFEAAALAVQDAAQMASSERIMAIVVGAFVDADERAGECEFRLDPATEAGGAEELLARAAALVAAREAAAAAKACRSDFHESSLMRRLRAREFDDGREQNLMKAFVVLQAYRAIAARSPEPCALLDLPSVAVGVSVSGADRCREMYGDLASARALAAREPSFIPACRENIRLAFPDRSSEDAERVCGLILAGVDDPAALCKSLIPKDLDPLLERACVARYSSGACGALSAGPSLIYDVCVDLSSYDRARLSGRAEDCGASKPCRLMLGEGAAVIAEQREALAAMECEAPPPPASLARVETMLSAAARDLEAREKARRPGDLKLAAELDALQEKAARLTIRARQ